MIIYPGIREFVIRKNMKVIAVCKDTHLILSKIKKILEEIENEKVSFDSLLYDLINYYVDNKNYDQCYKNRKKVIQQLNKH